MQIHREYLWAPAGTGKGGTCLPRKCYEVFCALVVTVKRSVDQLFVHHFYNFSSASGGFTPDTLRGSTPRPRWSTFVSRSPDLPTPGKKLLEKILRAPMGIGNILRKFAVYGPSIAVAVTTQTTLQIY